MKRCNFLIVILLVAISVSVSQAEEKTPNFLLIRNKDRLVFIHNIDQSSIVISGQDPVFLWEGRASRATFTDDNTATIHIEFKLDIIGPDWLYITLDDTRKGLSVHEWRISDQGTNNVELFEPTWYPNYEAFLHDPKVQKEELDVAVQVLLERYGQNPNVPDVSRLRCNFFGFEMPYNSFENMLCRHLIQELNNEDCKVRNAASEMLERQALTERALILARGMHLTPEQHGRIDALAAKFKIHVRPEFVDMLAKIALSPDEIAARSK